MIAKKPEETVVQFDITWENGRVINITTTSPPINHFLELIKLTRAHNTWVNYAHDLKIFFTIVGKQPEYVSRQDCLAFMKQQDEAGLSNGTLNRRLAAVSSLFNELQILEPSRFPKNPIQPGQRWHTYMKPKQSLYRKQAQRIPSIIPENDMHSFFEALPTWRDRTLVLLMWLSCLRISEAVTIRFQDIECDRRSIKIPITKGNNPRTVFMDSLTFTALNRYLDEERRALYPEVDTIFIAFKGKARGQPLSVNAVQKMLRYYGEQCGLPHIHAHLFRHTGITQLVQQGMSEPAIRQFVGHRSPDSLLPYLHLHDEFVTSEFEQAQIGLDASYWLDTPFSGGNS